MSKKLTVVTDIPTPYRIHLFNQLHDALRNYGVGFDVFFMARTVPIRFWKFDEGICRFTFKIFAGIHPRAGNNFFHFNPGMIWAVRKARPEYLMLGGAWHMPTVVSLLFGVPFSRTGVHKILWAEANFNSSVHKTGLIPRVRSAVAGRASAYAVPGRIAEDTVRDYWRVADRPFLRLPNLVNEELFRDRVCALREKREELRRASGLSDDDLVLLWPARLHEETKGIINFLSAVKGLLQPRVKVILAGEGPDRRTVENWLVANSFKQVSLLGQRSEEQMLQLFAIADVLLLPSLRDPNPLSVIEALWAGLPLLISRSCGNWPETLEDGRNGWLMDAESPLSMQKCFADLLLRSSTDMRAYGRRSLEIAEERFNSRYCVNKFVRDLLKLRQ